MPPFFEIWQCLLMASCQDPVHCVILSSKHQNISTRPLSNSTNSNISCVQLPTEIRYVHKSQRHLLWSLSIRQNSTTSNLDEISEDSPSQDFWDHVRNRKSPQIRCLDIKRSIERSPIELLKSRNDDSSNLEGFDEERSRSDGLASGVINHSPVPLRSTEMRPPKLSNRLKKARRLSSLDFLGKWLDLPDDDAREVLWQHFRSEKSKSKVSESALPTILLQHIRVFLSNPLA